MHAGFNNISIKDILAYLCDCFGKLFTLELEEAGKLFNNPCNSITPFGTFVWKIKEKIDLVEAASCPYTP